MNSGSFSSAFSSEKFKCRTQAPLREVRSTVYLPPLRSSSMPNSFSRKSSGDRFIPDRSAMDMDYARYQLTELRKEKENTFPTSPAKEAYRKLLAETCLNNRTHIFSFKSKPPTPTDPFVSESSSSHHVISVKPKRYILNTTSWQPRITRDRIISVLLEASDQTVQSSDNAPQLPVQLRADAPPWCVVPFEPEVFLSN